MGRALAKDGIELHWEERGSGPTVVLAAYWSYAPSVWEHVAAELERDHRVIRYDDRGTGRSDRVGPYDLETATDDLETIVEVAGSGPAVAIGLMDGSNKAARVAARRPDLISHVVSPGGAPIGRRALEGSDSMIASNTVIGAFMQQLETDYRGAVRGVVTAANQQMGPEELRTRVAEQVEHVPVEPAAQRVREWADDEETEAAARGIGERLVVLLSNAITGNWFPDAEAMRRVLREHFPEARIHLVEDGIVSRPDLTARAVRSIRAVSAQRAAS